MALHYVVRPLTDVAWVRPGARSQSRFTTTWTDTLNLLEREISMIVGKDVVIGVKCTEADLRIDGMLRANARIGSPAVEVAFESKHGPLIYRCDRYSDGPYGNRMQLWQHNVRAIALTLEALRAVDRYGATASGEQYRGFRAIGAEPATVPHGRRWAIDLLWSVVGTEYAHSHDTQQIIARAKRLTHPDSGSVVGMWHDVQEAERVLDKGGS